MWLGSEQARAVLTNAAYVHLKRVQFSKFASQLSAASQAILLSGPEGICLSALGRLQPLSHDVVFDLAADGFYRHCIVVIMPDGQPRDSGVPVVFCISVSGTEAYHQRIAKALAHNFEANLLLLDVTDLVSKVRGNLRIGWCSFRCSSRFHCRQTLSCSSIQVPCCCSYSSAHACPWGWFFRSLFCSRPSHCCTRALQSGFFWYGDPRRFFGVLGLKVKRNLENALLFGSRR